MPLVDTARDASSAPARSRDPRSCAMNLRSRLLVSALPALTVPAALAQQSWPVPTDVPGVEALRDERGHEVRAARDVTADVQPQASSLVANWQALGPFGGDIDDVQVSPTNPSLVLAGLAPATL